MIRKHQEGPKELLAEKKSRLRRYMPLAEMRKKGWFLYDDTLEGLSLECKRLFGENDIPEQAFLKAGSFYASRSKEDEEYTAWYSNAWYQVAKLRAAEQDLFSYKKEKFRKLADRITEFALREKGIEEFINAMRDCGVGFFVLSHLQKTYFDNLDNAAVSDIEKEADFLAAEFLHIAKVIEEGKKVSKYLSAERLSALSKGYRAQG